MGKMKFSPSLMCMDLTKFKEQVDILNERADYYHVDIMDGHFVTNITISMPAKIVKANRGKVNGNKVTITSLDFLTYGVEITAEKESSGTVSSSGVSGEKAEAPSEVFSDEGSFCPFGSSVGRGSASGGRGKSPFSVFPMFLVCDLTMGWLSFSLFLRLMHWM